MVSGLCMEMDANGCSVSEYDHSDTMFPSFSHGDTSYQHRPTGLTTDLSLYINEALAKGNPGSPTVDLAAFIAELRDLPETFRALSKLTQAPIATSFGVIPTLGDIQAICDLTDSIAARQDQLRKLSQGTQKERLSIAYRQVKDEQFVARYVYSGHDVYKRYTTSARVWAVKSHRIKTNPMKPPPKYDTSYVRRLLTSASSLATFWELMPWSWLIDYFVGIQSMIAGANGNRVPGYVVESLCVCMETKTHYDIIAKGRSKYWTGGTYHPGSIDILTQTRRIFKNPSPGFPRVMGYLSDGHTSNIAQLLLAMSTTRKSISPRMYQPVRPKKRNKSS